ncbi:TIGR02611 family protein [Streptomyces pseudogriseolus]|uniref:TIGR02611 family protein n=1 Tax=Streptomyces pseudogriseolus TaxID=36817 RepID=UPI003FA3020F
MNAENDEQKMVAATMTVDSAAGDDRATERNPGTRAPGFIQKSSLLRLGWQAGIFVVGLAVIGVGIAMLVLPGPGWLVIFGGMAIWATEFAWAQIVLRWTRRKVTEAAQRALDPGVRRRNIILTTALLLIITALAGIYLWNFGIAAP